MPRYLFDAVRRLATPALTLCFAAGAMAVYPSASGASASLPQGWPPQVEKDGYLPGAPGYVRFSEGPAADHATVGCAERGGPHARARVAFGPVDADGWVQYIDLLRCDSDKRLLRIKAPNAQLAPSTDAKSLIAARKDAEKSFFQETPHGSLLYLRSGEVKWLNLQLKEIDYDPQRTLFSSHGVLHLLDEPGLFLPYLKPGERFQPPKGMQGFMYVQPEAGAFDRPAESFRQRIEVWQAADGRRYGACSHTVEDYRWLQAQPPTCGPQYRQVEARVLAWDSAAVKRATSLVLLGEREDGRWEVAHSQANPLINPDSHNSLKDRPGFLATPAELALLAPKPKPELLASLGEVYAGRLQQQERANEASSRIQQANQEADARWAAEMARQRREAVLADLERRRQEAEARRAAVDAAIASGDERCWKTTDCGLSARQRYNMAIKADDRAGAHQIALAAIAQDRSLIVEDIRRDWANVAPGRGPAFWREEQVHAVALRDTFVRQGIGAEIWKHAERWASMRDYNTMRRNADSFWSQLANMGTIELKSLSGARPLSAMEQDYYVGKGYVVVRRPRARF